MKNATFRQIRVFEAVARHLNYSRAAEELRVSQPGVSIHVKQLEAHAGLPLFEATGEENLSDFRRSRNAALQSRHHPADQGSDEALAALKGIRGGRLDIAVISAGDYFFSRPPR